jgi:acyl-CoA thioester hydrolase
VSTHAPQAVVGEPMFVAEVTVRWGDVDAFQHVNNAAYLVYLEEARLQWMQHVGDWHTETSAPVLAASELNYRRPITWPTRLHVELRCERIGTSSMTVQHRLVDADQTDRLFSDGNVVLVWMDTTSGKPLPLPTSVRAAAETALAG